MNFREIVVSGFLAAVLVASSAGAGRAEGEKTGTVTGYVVDSACVFVRNVKKPLKGGQCALECAKAGSPLVILAHDGTIYWPISDAMPATGQNPRLMEFAGQQVAARGKVFERGGSHALAIETIGLAPERK